jgi:hypothetical protein
MAKRKSRRKPRPTTVKPPLQRGQPGYRNRGNRTGLDPMDTYAEVGYAEGLLIKGLFTGRLRTRNPFYLLLLTGLGVLLMLPLVVAIWEYIDQGIFNLGLVCFIPMGIVAGMCFFNVILSVKLKK